MILISDLKNKHSFGIGLVIAYCILIAGADVYIGKITQTVDPFLLAFLFFIIIISFFSVIYFIKDQKKTNFLILVKENYGTIIAINIITACNWGGICYSLKYIEPAIVNGTIAAFSPILSILVYKNFRPLYPPLKSEKLCAVILFFTQLALFLGIYLDKTGLKSIQNINVLVGLILCVLAGFSSSVTAFLLKNLTLKNFPTSLIISLRFILIMLLSFFFIPSVTEIGLLSIELGTTIASISLLGWILPMYLLIKGIELTEPILVSIIISSVPALTFLLEFLDPRISLSYYTLTTIMLLTSMIMYASYKRVEHERVKIE